MNRGETVDAIRNPTFDTSLIAVELTSILVSPLLSIEFNVAITLNDEPLNPIDSISLIYSRKQKCLFGETI